MTKSRGLLLTFGLVLVWSLLASISPVRTFAVTTDPAQDLKRRTLHTFLQCLEKDVIDEDDDIGGDDPYGDLFDNNEDEEEKIVVGFDRESGNGVMTCDTVIRQGLAIIEPGTTDHQAWLIKTLTGTTFQETGGDAISNDKIEENRQKLYNRVQTERNKIDQPNDALRRKRFAPLVGLCYDMAPGGPTKQLGSEDFEVQGVGTFTFKDDFDDDSVDWLDQDGNSLNNNHVDVGNISLGFNSAEDLSGRGGWEPFTSDFYPIGSDIGQTSSYHHSAIVDCEFVKKNRDLIFAGTKIENGELVDAASGEVLTTNVGDGGSSGGAGGTGEESCESEGGDLGWILCSLLGLIDNVISKMDETLNTLLRVPDPYLQDDGVEGAWRRLRNIAYILLIPIMLVMVIGTALGFEFISAYTVKKAMPRLIAAVLFITLSYPICAFLITLTNAVGGGIMGLITNSVAGAGEITISSVFNPDGKNVGAGFLVGTAGGAAILAVGSIGILFSYALVAFTGILIGFIALAFRQFLLIALLLFAPVAIVAWIFPGNDKLWKLWWGTFSKLLLLYPLIMVLIATGRAFASIVQEVSSQGGDAAFQGGVATFIKIVAYVGPYFFIPAVFKFAGGIFATVSGMANDRSRGLFDRQKKYRGKKMGETWQDTQAGNRFKGQNAFSRKASSALQTASLASAGGLTLSTEKRRARMQTARASRDYENAKEFLEKNEAARAIKNDDDKLWAAMSGNNEQEVRDVLRSRAPERFSNPAVLNQAVAEVMRFKRESGSRVGKVAATIAQAGTGTGFNYRQDGIEDDMLNAIIGASGDDRGLSGRMLADMRQSASQSGRVDLAGGGFAKQAQVMDKRRAALGGGAAYSADEARLEIMQDVLQSNAGAAIAGKVEAVRQLAPVMKANADVALASGDSALAARELAKLAGKYDAASQVAPQNAEALAEGVLAQEINFKTLSAPMQNMLSSALVQARDASGTALTNPDGSAMYETVTYQKAIEALRSNSDFQTMRREYATAGTAAAAAAAGAAPPGAGGTGPTPIVPITPPHS